MPLAEVAPVYSIAQSARGRGVGGTSRLGALLGLGLMLGDIPRVGPLRQEGGSAFDVKTQIRAEKFFTLPRYAMLRTGIVHPYRPYIR